MSDGLEARGLERGHEDWTIGNGEPAWENPVQERAQVLSATQRIKNTPKRLADLELELAELRKAFSMLSEFVRQREVRESANAVSSPLDTYLASLGDDADGELPRVEFSQEMIASLLSDE